MFNSEFINNLSNYPTIGAFQEFIDDRGSIINIANGQIGDVAVINSAAGSIRASHFHKKDWHICFLIKGKLLYSWKNNLKLKSNSLEVKLGTSIITPPLVPHKFEFIEESTMVVVSHMSRLKSNYDADTTKLEHNFFI
jgi:dTDP-4-dehydrorhamnose 3,5-epimerase-like enzyme